MYRESNYTKSENLPVASRIADKVICLPIYPELDRENIKRIIQLIKNYSK